MDRLLSLFSFCVDLVSILLQCVPELNRFNMNDFFRTLETAGPRLTCDVKGDWVGLYK